MVEIAEVQDRLGRRPGGSGSRAGAEIQSVEPTGCVQGGTAVWSEGAHLHDVHHHPQQSVEELDQRVTHRNRHAAFSTPATEFQPAQDRDVVDQPNGMEAPGASRRRVEQALPATGDRVVVGQAVDTDVQKAANDAAQDEDRHQDIPDGQTAGYHVQSSWPGSAGMTAATSSMVRRVVSIVNVWQSR